MAVDPLIEVIFGDLRTTHGCHYVDDGSAAPPGTVIATAAVNTVYRGVATSAK